MKLNNIELSFDNFASEMAKLKNEKHFDYLVTIIGEDFGEEGLGCIYILENTQTNERCSVKTIAKKVDGSDVIPTVINLWKVAGSPRHASSLPPYRFPGLSIAQGLRYES